MPLPRQLFVDREKQPEGGDTQYGAEFGKLWHCRSGQNANTSATVPPVAPTCIFSNASTPARRRFAPTLVMELREKWSEALHRLKVNQDPWLSRADIALRLLLS
jgi:hypothetical protein